jgi:hypothetical protein
MLCFVWYYPTEISEIVSWSFKMCHLSNSSSPSSRKKLEDLDLSWPPRENRLEPFLDLLASELVIDSILSGKADGSLDLWSILFE